MARAYFQIYFSSRRVLLEKLTDAQRGRVLTAAFDYAELGQPPSGLDAQEDIAFETLRVWIDKNNEHYTNKCTANQANGKRGGRPRKGEAEPSGEDEKTQKTQSVSPFKEKEKAKAKAKEKEKAVAATRACAREDAPDGAPPPLPEPERFFLENGFGRQLSPFIRQQLDDYRAAGMEDALLLYAMQEAVTNGSGWAYARAVLERCARENVHTLAENAQRRGPRPSGRNVPVSRETPGGGDFLAGAMDRPRRLKRKD